MALVYQFRIEFNTRLSKAALYPSKRKSTEAIFFNAAVTKATFLCRFQLMFQPLESLLYNHYVICFCTKRDLFWRERGCELSRLVNIDMLQKSIGSN